jgi:hypothetical protein
MKALSKLKLVLRNLGPIQRQTLISLMSCGSIEMNHKVHLSQGNLLRAHPPLNNNLSRKCLASQRQNGSLHTELVRELMSFIATDLTITS